MERLTKISKIIDDLKCYKNNVVDEDVRYALEKNICFFQASKTVFNYMKWLLFIAPKLQKNRLLEVTDFSSTKYDIEMYEALIEVEKKKFPGLINPIVKKIIGQLIHSDKSLIILSLGSGGMEVERQVLQCILTCTPNKFHTFIAIDSSDIAHKIARKNLDTLSDRIDIDRVNKIDDVLIKQIQNTKMFKNRVVYYQGDIFDLKKNISETKVDIVFSTLFKHHLSFAHKAELENMVRGIAQHAFEYDGYRSFCHTIPQAITAWQNPVFLNASIISNLRYCSKKELRRLSTEGILTFYKIGSYLLEYKH